jgi:hypothetical protein
MNEQNILPGFECMRHDKIMELFISFEFTELHSHITLIDFAVVAETGETFYTECINHNQKQMNEWVSKGILKNLTSKKEMVSTDDEVKIRDTGYKTFVQLQAWVKRLATKYNMEKFHIWSDTHTFNKKLFYQIFGSLGHIPNCAFYIPFNISDEFKSKGINPDIDKKKFAGDIPVPQKYSALHDAMVIKKCHEKMKYITCSTSDKREG